MPPDTAERRPGGGGVPDAFCGDVTTSVQAAADSGGELRAALDKAMAEHGCTMKDLTVLAPANDPFRVDTPARHRDGEWLAITAGRLGLGRRRIHLRGLHYMLIDQPKPDGQPYTNTDDDWLWLQEHAAKAARFLGYIPWDQVTDQRNAEPEVRIFEQPRPRPFISVGVQVDIPEADDIEPVVGAYYMEQGKGRPGFGGAQPYHLVMVGEKSSLADVLGPVAASHKADLYLPKGEPSDTMLYRMAATAATDGRPMVVFYFSDCDPSGWNMPVSVSQKLRAFKVLLPDMPEFEVRRVALSPEQVAVHGLPSTPLKATERRADRWQQAMGVQQTEIDSLASLRPDLLDAIARDALAPFFDRTLDQRVMRAYGDWRDQAQSVVDASVDSDYLGRLRADAAEKLAALREEIDAINDALRMDISGVDLPPIVIPEPVTAGSDGLALLDSRWDFADQCRALIESKAYRGAP